MSDDEQDLHPVDLNSAHAGSSSHPRFDLDDAFLDEDDAEVDFRLSSADIRAELAKQRQPWNDEEIHVPEIAPSLDGGWGQAQINGDTHTEDTSISTIDIGRRALDSTPSSKSSPHSRSTPMTEEDMPGISNEFSQISLSDDHGPQESVTCSPQQEELPRSHSGVNGGIRIEQEPQAEPDFAPYPSVIIDASQPPTISNVHVPEEHAIAPRTVPSPALPPVPPETPSEDPGRTSSAPPYSPSSPSSPKKLSSAPSSPAPSASLSPTTPESPRPRHRPTKSTGPSMFEQVVSRTRPTHLPPKPKDEDIRHMKDWEDMMRLSRAAEERRVAELQERRRIREQRVEASLLQWEHEIVPDWRVVYKNPTLRRLWWAGIPTKLRAGMWEKAVGNPLALSKDNYRACLARATRALSHGTFPSATLSSIDEDVSRTLPALRLFDPATGPLHAELREMLCAWAVSRADEGLGYVHGAARLAAMILITMPPPRGFLVMRNMMERHCLRSFYGGETARDDVEAYYRIFDTLLADGMPKIYFNFKQHQISPREYLPDWLLPIFLDHLPFEACARLWDVIVLEGDSFLYRAALGVLGVLEPRLFFPDRKELMELLRGENKAALEVAKRDGRSLDGGRYEIYGLDEETLWERIDSMEDWWKESTWRRLIQRELPDI